jgi:hypothetical protein
MSYQERKKEIVLDDTLSKYRTAMRWGRWDTCLSFRDLKAPAVPEQDLDNIQVTSYEIRQPPVSTEEDSVLQVVEIQYVLRDRQRLRKVYDKQDWRFDVEQKVWRLHSPFPEFQ